MGQQQLLLLVLGIVIVGLAVVVGIQAFSENQKKANADALVMTAMRIASDAQAWVRKPSQFGGAPLDTNGDRYTDFSMTVPPTLEALGYPINGNGNYADINGEYEITTSSGSLIIAAASAAQSGSGDNNLICVTVAGVLVTDITTEINAQSPSCTAPS